MGEHNLESTDEPHPHVDRRVERIVIYPEWNDFADMYDVALLELDIPVEFALHVIPICLPEDDNNLIGRIAWTKGYGNQEQGNMIMLL